MVAVCGCSQGDDTLNSPPLEPGVDVGYTVSELIEPYIRDRVARAEYGRDRVHAARSTLYRLSDHVGRRRLQNIGETHIESWIASMGHLAPATRRDRLSTARMFFKWAIRKGYCKKNPAYELQIKQPRVLPRALPRDAISAVLEHCPDTRGRLIVTLMVQQGLRCIEVARLTMGDLDWNYNTMRVIGKGGHERILPITAETRTALDDYLHEHPAQGGPLIRSYSHCHRPLTGHYISTIVAGWMLDAGVKHKAWDGVGAHAGRHTCATDMLRRGAHIRDVQAALGHRFIATTEVYLPFVVNGLDEAMSGRTYRGVGPSPSDGTLNSPSHDE